MSFMADHALWKQQSAGGHLTNILLHVAAALAFYSWAVLLLKKPESAWWAALFFAAHPAHAEAVAHISGRSEPMVFLLVSLSYLFYMTWERRRNLIFFPGVLMSFILALLCKGNALILPLVLCLHRIAFSERSRDIKAWGLALGSAIAVSVLYLYLRMADFKTALMGEVAVSSLVDRLPGAFAALLGYVRIFFLPFGLHFDYGDKLFLWKDPHVIGGVLLFFIWVAALWRSRRKHPVAFFGMSWFLCAFLPVSNLYPLPYYMADRWFYIPSAGLFLILGGWVAGRPAQERSGRGVRVLSGALLALLTCLTVAQNRYWLDPILFYQRTLKYSPRNAAIYTALGAAFEESGRTVRAIAAYREAIRLRPEYAAPYNSLGLLFVGRGRVREGVAFFEEAIRVDPGFAKSYNNLGTVVAGAGDNRRAIELFKEAIRREPDYPSAYFNLGSVYVDLGESELALAAFKKAIELDPRYARAYDKIGIVYRALNRTDDAVAFYERSIELDPRNPDPYYNLAVIYLEKDEVKRAYPLYRRAHELAPGNIDIMNGLASLYRKMGRHDKATELYDRALEKEPDNPILYFNLGNVSMGLGRRKEAIELYMKAIELDPVFGQALDNLSVAYYYEKDYAAAAEYAARARQAGVVNEDLIKALEGEKGI
jgi:tetratricopeptide (TPR) repeat protein